MYNVTKTPLEDYTWMEPHLITASPEPNCGRAYMTGHPRSVSTAKNIIIIS